MPLDDVSGGKGASPSAFVSTLGRYVEAKAKEESAAGLRRAIKAEFEKLGVPKGGFDLFWKLRSKEPAEAELILTTALRCCRWAGLEVGAQASLFASDDAGMPTETATGELTRAVAYSEGVAHGRAGEDRNVHRFMLGSPLAAEHDRGWIDGQASLAAEMGVERPEQGALKREKARREPKPKPGVETRSAAPRGGRRRSALDAARDHLGG